MRTQSSHPPEEEDQMAGGSLRARRPRAMLVGLAAGASMVAAAIGGAGPAAAAPTFKDAAQISASTTPPTEAQCFSAKRRCFTPGSLRASYNINPLYANGF